MSDREPRVEDYMARLNIDGEEDDDFEFRVGGLAGEGEFNANLCLLGRFLSDKPIRSHIMKDRLSGIWRPGRGVSIKEVEPGLFRFQFFHKVDLLRILNGGPWSFDNYMLVLTSMQIGDVPSEIPLNHITMWVQVHDLPIGFMSQIVAQHLGNFIGQYVEYDPNNDKGGWRSYMRVRVRVDVRNPLKIEKKVRRPGGEWRS